MSKNDLSKKNNNVKKLKVKNKYEKNNDVEDEMA